MDNIEGLRAMAESARDIARGSHHGKSREDLLLRYLGATFYEARHGRAKPEQVERVVARVEEHVREHGPITRHEEEQPR